ncbi:MAG: hypothetical protein EAZ24_06490 [Burkholderiales bacterium]|nr:MAG: hypothetical protein EAZ24_06490 [Burkholderiales bacterium]TAG82022.1 MAG: hypothetical protein EAZ21_04580 [Betaproteobacteria bacterium]
MLLFRSHRHLALIALAFVVLAMQSLALVHRIAHGSHAHHEAAAHADQAELWLIVANGGEVSEAAWTQSTSPAPTDPWHAHENASDCERFDAIAAAHALLSATSPTPEASPLIEVFTRNYIANIADRTPRAHARAPPLATAAAHTLA